MHRGMTRQQMERVARGTSWVNAPDARQTLATLDRSAHQQTFDSVLAQHNASNDERERTSLASVLVTLSELL